jgi:hypothetical protein
VYRAGPKEAAGYQWVARFESIEEMRPLLLAIADDVGRAWIIDDSSDWLYHPYDGGADVIVLTTEGRDALANRFASWVAPE